MMKLDHIQLAIPKGAENQCRAFWVDLLGFQEVEKPADLQARGGAWFVYGETELHLGVDPQFIPQKKAHPAFLVSDISGLARKTEAAGFRVTWDESIPEKRRFFTDDPVGNRIEFIEET